MAASSSSGGHMMMASSSSSGKPCKYDVFLSFRGKDTRKIFIGHLHRALKRKTINAFIDSEDLIKGNNISELFTAIEDSRISIVVLSRHYASSEWCLKELAKILDCMDKKKQIVLPIFYQVDISDVRNINGTFAEDFAKHGENHNLDRQELESWRSALTRVAVLSGWDSSKFEDNEKLIEEVVGDTLRKWIHTSSSKANGLVGMDSHITEMNSRLCLEVNDVRFIGIWGMGGLGKTTIARAIYNDIACQFEHSCFLYNVKEAFINKGEVQMQEKLLSGLLNEKVHSFDLDRGRGIIMERLSTKKVLVVLDDVETFTQIEALLGEPHAFGDGSRIIVTTRNKRSLSGVDETYAPRYLSDDEALDLFRRYAFKTKNRQKGNYDPLARSTIEYAQGLPLALKVLGAFLDNVSVCEWEDVLKKLKEIPNMDILQVLRTSFDDKLDGFVKDIFLDIACIFGGGYKKSFVTKILNGCGFFPHSGLRVLDDRALISMTKDSEEAEDDFQAEVDIHDLLQDMGKEIVRLESEKEPGKRSRLWRYEDVDRVLTRDTATDAVECLMLDLSKSEVDSYCINAGAFVRMTKLRYLMIYYSFHTIFEEFNDHSIFTDDPIRPLAGCKQLFKGEMDLEFLSHELRFLVWHGCPLQFWPSTYIPKNLVQLDMRCSHITELWEGIKPLQNLKVVLLSRCSSLTKIPDLTEAINLETLLLDGCSSLVEVHPSISALENLVTLDLIGCKELKSLPSINRLKSLRHLLLSDCSKLEKLPEISEVMNKLTDLSLGGTAIKELPSSVNNLTGLVIWGLDSCTELKTLPSSIHMSSLELLDLSGCSSLEKFPEISGIMAEVSQLYLHGTAIKGLPSSIDQLQGLRTLSMKNCESLESLPDSICNLADLTDLDLRGCSALHNLPENLGDLQSLEDLKVEGSGIRKLPFSIIRLGKLSGDKLSCFDCQEMTAPLSAWPSSTKEYRSYSVLLHLELSECNLLELSDGIAHLTLLKSLELTGNPLESLPVTMNRLCSLRHLILIACERLKSIPELSSSISHINAHYCTALATVSKPKPPVWCHKHYSFTFSNCHQLVQTNLFRELVETHPHLQDGYLRPLWLKMSLPGSEVPNWFNHQSGGFSVSVQLQPDWFSSNFLGFAVCAVCRCEGTNDDTSTNSEVTNDDTSPVIVDCLCTFKGDCGERSFSVDLLGSELEFCHFTSDHMLLRYVSWTDFPVEEGKLVKEAYTEATFQILVGSKFVTEQLRIKSCGVRFVYAILAETLNLNKPQPRVHVDSCDTGVGFMETYEVGNKETARVKTLRVIDFSESSSYGLPHSFHGNESIAPTIHFEGLGAPSFPDQFETRKSGTEWEAESSETAAGRGTCQTLELLPERKEENEIIMVVAQWEGCRVLGSVCCCSSLSGCTLPLRRRETEREENRVTRISDGVEILELDSHSGLVVPDSQKEGKEEEELELMREESLARRGLLGPLCSCFYWLGELWHRKSEVAEPK